MVSLIVAYSKNKVIGNDNKIPWRLKNDMQRVKQLTTGQTIIMGRKTFESIGRPLPNRENRILTRNIDSLKDYQGIKVYSNSEEALQNIITDKVFIFGGSAVYENYFSLVDEMFITEVDVDILGDVKFPEFSLADWQLIDEQVFKADDCNEYGYKFLHYMRKKED